MMIIQKLSCWSGQRYVCRKTLRSRWVDTAERAILRLPMDDVVAVVAGEAAAHA